MYVVTHTWVVFSALKSASFLCAKDQIPLKMQVVSTALFSSGISTIFHCFFGARFNRAIFVVRMVDMYGK